MIIVKNNPKIQKSENKPEKSGKEKSPNAVITKKSQEIQKKSIRKSETVKPSGTKKKSPENKLCSFESIFNEVFNNQRFPKTCGSTKKTRKDKVKKDLDAFSGRNRYYSKRDLVRSGTRDRYHDGGYRDSSSREDAGGER